MIKLFNPIQPPEIYLEVRKVLESGRYVKGPKVEELEEKWAKLCGMKYGIAVSSGAMALELSIQVLTEFGHPVSITQETFKAVGNAVERTGRAISYSEKPLIYAHHLHDQKPDYKPLIEDCSHCHGYKPVADTAIFSFFPTKILGACGDGGIIVTNDKKVYNQCKELRTHNGYKATNARMDEIQAVILLIKLKYLDEWLYKRRSIADLYDSALGIETPGNFHYAYCISGSEEKRQKLLKMGIESAFYYTHKYMALPLNPYLTDDEVKKIIICALKL